MHERQIDARRDLLHRDVVGEVRADAPVLLVEDVVVDPAAARAPGAAGGSGTGRTGRRARAPARSRRSPARTGRCARTRGSDARRRTTPSRTAARSAPPRAYARAAAAFAARPRAGPRSDRRRRPSAPSCGEPARDLTFTAPDVEHAAARRRGARRRAGRICSSYSGSAPSVNSSCHHRACVSQRIAARSTRSASARRARGSARGTGRCSCPRSSPRARACPRRRPCPPPSPPSGPRSMIQSADLMTSRLCSITSTVLPASTRRCSTPSSRRTSSKWRPVVGSSRM